MPAIDNSLSLFAAKISMESCAAACHAAKLTVAGVVSKDDEFSIEHEKLCIKNENFCVKNEDFWIKMMNFAERR